MAGLAIRHPPTALNSESGTGQDRLRGWVDLPLTAEGEQQAWNIARDLGSQPIHHICSTDLQRGAILGELLSQATGAPLTLHTELRPWHYGKLAGEAVAAVKDQLDYAVAHPLQPFPDGESFFQFLSRFLPFVLPLVRDDRLTAIVTHGRNVKALEASIAAKGYGLDMETWKRNPMIGPGEAMLVTLGACQPVYTRAEAAHG